LLATKFFPPVVPVQMVDRLHLRGRVTAVADLPRPLTLVSAPAGYGKSLFVSHWLQQQPHPFAWLSLDSADDQPIRFFTCFTTALRRLDESYTVDLFATLQAGHLPPPDALVPALSNEMLAWQGPHILVLDDFHHIQDSLILDLLAQQPPRFHLVLATREDPPLPLARWRARGQLTELRATDLRFSEAETDQFLRQGLGLALFAADVTRLTERTEGWPAGLQLAGMRYHVKGLSSKLGVEKQIQAVERGRDLGLL
jgi:LuxR family transcriptional regulator, maltose regulon positive regulatory protein